MNNLKGIKGIKGVVIVSGIDESITNGRTELKNMFYQPNKFNIIEPKNTRDNVTYTCRAGFIDMSKCKTKVK